MFRPAPRPRLVSTAFLLAAIATVTVAPAGAQTLPAPPEGLAAPDDLAAPEAPGDARVQQDGIDARRFTPDPAGPSTGPATRSTDPRPTDPRLSDPRATNGYEYRAPSAEPLAPLVPAPAYDPRLTPDLGIAPGLGGQPGFDPNASPVLLGVSGTDTAAGVLVTRVVPGTPADLAGLEPGDRVLTVGGFQVGVVAAPNGRRVYPLGVELARRLDVRGEAALLVQDRRTGQITVVTVRPVPRYGPGDVGPAGFGFDNRQPAGGLYGPAIQNPYGPNPYGGGFGTGPSLFDRNPFGGSRFDPYGRDRLDRDGFPRR